MSAGRSGEIRLKPPPSSGGVVTQGEGKMLNHNHQPEPVPEARSPGVILDRALANARRDEQPRGWLSEALREAADPHTVIDAARTCVGVAGLMLVILSGLGG